MKLNENKKKNKKLKIEKSTKKNDKKKKKHKNNLQERFAWILFNRPCTVQKKWFHRVEKE